MEGSFRSATRLEWVDCELCGAHDEEEIYRQTLELEGEISPSSYRCTNSRFGRHYRIVRCRRCGLTYANPRRPEVEILEGYARVVDDTYLAEQDGRYLTFDANLRMVERLLVPHLGRAGGRSVLEVGCYAGLFLDVARRRGWETQGVEVSRWASRYAREQLGLDVFTGTVGEAGFARGRFDLVAMWDVIEHLNHPMKELAEVWRVLRPGGFLCLHTIDIGSLFARVAGPRWPWLMEMHLYYFTQASLARVLERAGFEVVQAVTHGRLLRLGYLISRVRPYSGPLYRLLDLGAGVLGLRTLPVPVNFGDLFTMFARKPLGDQPERG